MKISELLGLSEMVIKKTKVHFAIGSNPNNRLEPLYSYYRNEFKSWQENQANKNFERDYIFSMIYFEKHGWLFGGVYGRDGVSEINGRFIYETTLLDIGTELIGRLVIKFEKKFRASYTFLEKSIEDFELLEILRDKYTIIPFTGFENVRISFDVLRSIVKRNEKSWKAALSNVKGVYLISDQSNGKLYVGSAYNQEAFWNRWCEYALTGHGDQSVELKKVIDNYGIEYANNFQFSILETRSMNAENDEIIGRESYWKNVLLTKKFGYNIN